jgi:hypothetical protein
MYNQNYAACYLRAIFYVIASILLFYNIICCLLFYPPPTIREFLKLPLSAPRVRFPEFV